MALLVRCPAMTERSCQPVKIRFWSKNSIGVHPAMCKPLHLDFDGDEVHIFMATTNVAADELMGLVENSKLDFLGRGHIKSLCREVIDTHKRRDQSFMIFSSTCLRKMRSNKSVSRFQENCGLKPKQCESFFKKVDFAEKVSSFVSSSMKSMKGVITSHHTVSNKYCASRALKYQCNSIVPGRHGVPARTGNWYRDC